MSGKEPWTDLLNNAGSGSYRIVRVDKGTIQKAVECCGTTTDMIDAALRNSGAVVTKPDPLRFGTPPYGDLPANLSSKITGMGSDLVDKVVPSYRAAVGQFGEALIKARGLMVAADRDEPAAAFKRITGDTVNTTTPPNGDIGPNTVGGSAPPPDCLDYDSMRTFAASLQQAPGSLTEVGNAWSDISTKLKASFTYLQTNMSAITKDDWKGDGADRAMEAMNRLVTVSRELTTRMDSMAQLLTEAAAWMKSVLDAMPPSGTHTTDKKQQNAQVRAANTALDSTYIPGLNSTKTLPQLPPPTGIKGPADNPGNGSSPHDTGGHGNNNGSSNNNHGNNYNNGGNYNKNGNDNSGDGNHNNGNHSTNNGPDHPGRSDIPNRTHETSSRAPQELHARMHIQEKMAGGTADHHVTNTSEAPATNVRGTQPASFGPGYPISPNGSPISQTTRPVTNGPPGDRTDHEYAKRPDDQGKKEKNKAKQKPVDPAKKQAQQAAEQQVLQVVEAALTQVPQVLQRITDGARSKTQQSSTPEHAVPGSTFTPGTVASALENAVKGATGRGGGGKSTSAPANDSAAPRDPATASKLFPRAMVAGVDNTAHDSIQAGNAPGADDPASPTMPPVGGMGGGMGGGAGGGAPRGAQGSKEHKRADYLNSAEHLDEAFGGTPDATKPVVGK